MSGSSDLALENRLITVTLSPAASFDLYFHKMRGTEELGRPFLYEVDLISGTQQLDLTSFLGTSMTVAVTQSDTVTGTRYFNGVVARMVYTGMDDGYHRYTAELRPWIWLLSRAQDCKIFQNQSVPDIITAVLSGAGFTQTSDNKQNTSNYTALDFCVQYRESTLDFITRLMETTGIYYYFTHASGQHTLTYADDPNSHSAATGAATIPYFLLDPNYRREQDHIWDWTSDLILQSGTYTLRDYNFTTPSADLTAKSISAGSHTYATFEVYDYPGEYLTASAGTTVATVRMQDLTRRRQVMHGIGNVRALGTGNTFTLSQHPISAQNAEYLVVKTYIELSMNEGWYSTPSADGQQDLYICHFDAIPSTIPFKLATQTPKPIVQGPQTAVIVGASGDEVTTDQYGRVKVKFFWDRSDVQDDNASCWVRVSQSWAGQGWGGILLPRVGQEVIVDFLEGDPDRPIITGRVYNATQTVPYTLPDNKTRSTLKSNSSTGGNGFNELRFEDKAGSEEVFFQAQKDLNYTILNNSTGTITQNATLTVSQGNLGTTVSQGNAALTVSQGTLTTTVSTGDMNTTVSQGKQTTTVSTGNREITVSTGDLKTTVSTGNLATTVSTGKASLTVSTADLSIDVTAGNASVTAGQSITLSVGSNSIKIDTTGITLTAAKIALTGTGQISASAGQISMSADSQISLSADAELSLSSSGIASLQGSLVKIN